VIPQQAISVPAAGKNASGGSWPAMAETLPDAKGRVSATYANGYTTMYLAVRMIRLRETANASFLALMIVVVVPAPLLLKSFCVVLFREEGWRAEVLNKLEPAMRVRRKKNMEM
jgi:hypothetical protein